MRLRPNIEISRLHCKPNLTPAERIDFRLLSKAYRSLRLKGSRVAEEVRDQAMQILRVRYHKDNDGRFRHNRLDEKEWSAVTEYFPERIHPQFFSSSMYDRSLHHYLRSAHRVFEHVSVRGRSNYTDFAIVGWEPGRTEPSLLARIYKDGAAAPHVYEIKTIIEHRRSFWQWTKPCLIGLTLGATAGIWAEFRLASYPLFGGDGWLVPFCAVLGMGIARGVLYLVNRHKAQKIGRMYPHLCIAP